MPVIDADSHVVETERTWTFMPDEQEEYRPAVLARKSGRTRASEYWLIDDRVFAKNANIGQDTPEGAREAADIAKDRKSTRLNSSHRCISYAVFCLKKEKNS